MCRVSLEACAYREWKCVYVTMHYYAQSMRLTKKGLQAKEEDEI